MRSHIARLLLLLAATCASPASAAVRWGLFNHRDSDQQLSNAIVTPSRDVTRSLTSSLPPSSTAFTFETSSSSPVLDGSQTLSSSLTIFSQGPNTSLTSDESPTSISAPTTTLISNPPNQASTSSASTTLNSISTTRITNAASSTFIPMSPSESNPKISVSSVDRPQSTPVPVTISTTKLTTRQDSSTSPPPTYLLSRSLSLWNTASYAITSTGLTSASDTKPCTELSGAETVTEYYIVYTSTTTLYGNYSAYTAPYPTIEAPIYCGTESPLPPEVTLTGEPMLTTYSEGFVVSTKQPAVSCSAEPAESDCWEVANPGPSTVSDTYRGKYPGGTLSTPRVTVTFVTTDKNPAVVYPTESAPDYRESGRAASLTVVQHKSARPDGDRNGGSGGGGSDGDGSPNDPQSQRQAPKTATATTTTITASYAVTARANQVIINDETFSSLKPDQTTTATLSHGTFTIFPSSVVGEGATVTKPQPVGVAVSVATPTTRSVGNLTVEVSGTAAIVNGTKIDIPPRGTTTVINNEEVSVGPGKVVVGDQTLTFRALGGPETAVVVQGGEMVTAVGRSVYVFHSTTLTYGPGIPETLDVVDDDTITIGPSGIILDGTTIGGTLAEATDTAYEIAGGATITKVAPSYVIIDGTTFTASAGSKKTTKVIGGETITIGPSGVVISSMTLSIPFGSSTVTTIATTRVKTRVFPEETGTSGGSDSSRNSQSNDDDEGDAGSVLEPSFKVGMTGLCIAIGVWVWL